MTTRAAAWLVAFLLTAQCANVSGAEAREVGALPAELAELVSYTPAEQSVFAQAEAGKLTNHQLFTAGLIAGGIHEPGDLQRFQTRWQSLVARVRNRLDQDTRRQSDPVQVAAAIHRFLHQELLVSYDLRSSRLAHVFETGRYNCVSATILFNALAAELGVETVAGEAGAHAVSIVTSPVGAWAVETTYPEWCQPRVEEYAAASAAAQEIGPTALAKYRQLNATQLVALVYYNVGVDLAEEHRYAEALAANVKALRLDPASTNARTNLLAAINNWGLSLTEQEQFAQAVRVLLHGLSLAPEHSTFRLNLVAVYERWARSLCQRAAWNELEAVLEEAAEHTTDPDHFAAVRRQLTEHKAQGGKSQ